MAASSLVERIDAEFRAAEERVKKLQSERFESYEGRVRRLEEFEHALDRLRGVWRPLLETLAEKFGQRVDVQPVVEPGRRSATFDFKSDLAHINMSLSAAPDAEVEHLIVSYDLRILPILMKFESHSEIKFPLGAIDETALAKWIEDRIVGFVQTYVSLHENEYYLREHMVEDPVAKVKFPKYAAQAELEVDGKTLYFIDQATLREFQQQPQGSESHP